MIIVKNREMLIPDDERNIGTTYDTESEFRSFRVPRFSQSGVDLSSHTFRLDLKYANDAYDTVVLTKDVSDNQIVLTWEITSSQLQVPGTLYIAIRAVDNEATVRWSTYTATMFVERHLNTPGNYTGDLTEIEQMEQDHQYMKSVVDELKEHLDYRSDAEAWAVGQRLGEDVESTDPTYHNNSKYYSEQAADKASAASNSATAAADSATQAAATVADTNTRFDNALRAVTTDTELADIRVKADGTTASSAGNAVREQVAYLNSDIGLLADYQANQLNLIWESGLIDDDTGLDTTGAGVRTTEYVEKSKVIRYQVKAHTGALYAYRYNYDSDTGTYTYLGKNQRTNSGVYTSWLKNLEGTHIRFTVGQANAKPNDWMIVGIDTSLNKKLSYAAQASMMGYWYQEIIVEPGSTHSGSADILPVNIPAGAKFSIVFEVEPFYRPQIYVYYSDGTNARIYSASVSTYTSHNLRSTAANDIIGIGVFIPGTSSNQRIYRHRIYVENSLAGNFDYRKFRDSYIRLPEGNLCFETGRDRSLVQSIAVVNNEVWEFAEGKAYYNGTEYPLANGHGNNCNWGKTLHGDYPYLYCPTWTLNEMNINVFSFDSSVGFTLERTIHIDGYTGYFNAYIDESAGFIYGFIFANNPAGKCTYIVTDLNGVVLLEKNLPYLIRTIQGMCMRDGVLYVVSGYGNEASPNYLQKISPDGSLLGKYQMSGIGEIEGIDFLDNKMVLASYYKFYINPVLVPETEFHSYDDQLKATT